MDKIITRTTADKIWELPQMANGEVVLDMSKAKLISATGRVKIDMSKAKPILGGQTRYSVEPLKAPWWEGTGTALLEEAKGLGDVAKGLVTQSSPVLVYQGIKTGIEQIREPGKAKAERQAMIQYWKHEYETFKADPYAYLLSKAPRFIGQAAGMVVTGKLMGDFPALAKNYQTARSETAAARITERLSPLTEGEPTAELVKRVTPGLNLTGKESMAKISQEAKRASLKISEIENKILSTPIARTAPKSNLLPWQEEVSRIGKKPVTTPKFGALGDTPISGQPIADKLRSLIDENMRSFEPRLVKQIEKDAAIYEKQNWTPRRMQVRLRVLNEEAKALYSKPEVEAALGQHNPRMKFLKQETDTVRNAYYENLSNLSGQDLRSLKQWQSDLIGLQKATNQPVAKELLRKAESKAHPILGPKGSTRRELARYAGHGLAWTAGAGAVYEGARKVGLIK
jgi:hypothetical protein